ncbi:acyl transferase/acyl hydrolase/lysophospholipase [Rhexocercosporidium sp. MPI-PUGE-AT-0058]|nr:acyl transferase/acyl hydrolase/lysophospholipase [Rhexocercosporidium sp. MPI-PUGE-AT-0058]
MSLSKSVIHPSLTGPSLPSGSPTKSFGQQPPSHEDTAGLIAESQRPGTSGSEVVASFTSSKGKENQYRLSQVAPRREKGKEIVREEEPWDAKNILSFDGGGIRGLYSLLILKLLMNNVRYIEEIYVDGTGASARASSSFHPAKEPLYVSHSPQPSQDDEQEQRSHGNFLPCHYFDYICGTSTGGLIAIMLGRLRMNVEDCITEYQQLAGGVFGNPRTFHQTFLPTFWMNRPKYDAANLEAIIKRVVSRRGETSTDDVERYFHTGQGMCRTFVFAYKKAGHDDNQRSGTEFEKPYIFRSYDHFPRTKNGSDISNRLRNPGSASSYPLWMIARATTAAPLYFAPMQVSLSDESPEPSKFPFKRILTGLAPPKPSPTTSRPVTFIDGGFGPANNPSKEAFHEVTLSNERIGTLVSIGTGRGSADKFHTRLLKFVKNGISAVGDPLPADQSMKFESKRKDHEFGYFRFNEHNGLPDLDFDEWRPKASGNRTQTKIREAFHRWSVDPKVTDAIRLCAIELVERRRLRTADESRWERYATKSYFDCKEDQCTEASDKRWYARDEFRDHLRREHRCMEEEDNLEEIIQRHRTAWRYKPPQAGNGGIN